MSTALVCLPVYLSSHFRCVIFLFFSLSLLFAVAQGPEYTSHSCDPNSYFRFTDDKIALVTIKDVKAGEWITFDYCTTEWAMAEPFKCQCGSSKCRGDIQGYKYVMRTRFQAELDHYLSPYIRKKKTQLELSLAGDSDNDPGDNPLSVSTFTSTSSSSSSSSSSSFVFPPKEHDFAVVSSKSALGTSATAFVCVSASPQSTGGHGD
jgi:hypothetical protein